MKTLVGIVAALSLAVTCRAFAVGSLAEVVVIDRDSGRVLTPYYYRGEYWVAGRPGARYAIEICSRSGGRILAVTSVDGVNVLSGETAGWGQSGYVFDPLERYQITGWRKSNAEVAAFTFSDAADSYAERTGRPANVGVIGVALFRERRPHPVYAPPRVAPAPEEREGRDDARRESANAPAAPAAADSRLAQVTGLAEVPADSVTERAQARAKLGTAHGEREYSYVVDTEFQRLQSEPNEIVRIRYDSFANLVAMGVIRRPPPPAAPEPFPGSRERRFVPDPPG